MAYEENKKLSYIESGIQPLWWTWTLPLPLISFLVRSFFSKKEKKNYVAVKFSSVLEIKRIDTMVTG